MTTRYANPGPIGFLGFSISTALNAMNNLGWFADKPSVGLALIIAFGIGFGGLAQLIAGFFEFKRGNTMAFTAFVAFGGYWVINSLILMYYGPTYHPSGFDFGVLSLVWALLAATLFLNSFAAPRVLSLLLFCVTTSLTLFAIGGLVDLPTVIQAGVYVTLVVAVIAFYFGIGDLYNEVLGREVVWLGIPKG